MSHYGFYYDSNKKELMGSDGLFKCDGRLNYPSTIKEARHQAKTKLPKGKAKYVRLFRGNIQKPSFYTDYIYIGD
jgi:hypothetical protein